MITLRDVRFHLQRVRYAIEEVNDQRWTAAQISLGLEPLTPAIAEALGHDIKSHCFDAKGKIRKDFTRVDFRLRMPRQVATVKMAPDVQTHIELRQVGLSSVTVTKRGEAKSAKEVGKKERKVAPQGETLRLTLSIVVSLADREPREFLAARFADTMFWSFVDELRSLPFEPKPGDDEERIADMLDEHDAVNEVDDVLDEQAIAEKKAEKQAARKTRPRLAKGAAKP